MGRIHIYGELARAIVTGIQKEGSCSGCKTLLCTGGDDQGGVNASAARIGERELWEIHLQAAKAGCEAGVKGIMGCIQRDRWKILPCQQTSAAGYSAGTIGV